MKKLIALIAVLALCLTAIPVLAEDANADLLSAKAYIYQMYKNPSRTDIKSTPVDFDVIGSVPVDGVEYTVEWSADSDTIKVIVNEDGSVTIDVDENNPSELFYKLTATVKDAAGNTASVSFDRKVPASLTGMTYEQIVDYAYTLVDGEKSAKAYRLYGTVIKIPTEWSEQYGNITVDIAIAGKEDMPIECYRLKGEGAKDLKVGDEIAVFGTIKNYKGLIEFDQGCVLIPVGTENEVRTLAAAYQLLDGEAMTSVNTLTGVISSIDTAYSEEYKNITVTIIVAGLEDYKVQCYRLAGEGAAELAVGDTITVTGTIKNYKGTIEFDKGCTLDAVVK